MRALPSRRSLALRLPVGIFITLLLSWGVMLNWYRSDVSRERTGEWDANLKVAAQTALMSLPQGIEQMALPEGFRPTDQVRVPDALMDLALQAYSLADGRVLLRSPVSPATPLVPSRQDGYATTQVDGLTWRTYAVSDADGKIQVQVGKSTVNLERELHERLHGGLIWMTVNFLLLAAVAWGVTHVTLLPIARLSASLRQRRAFDLAPLRTQGIPDEIAPLVSAFNQQQSRVAAAIENERRFLQDAAHELRTPLAILAMNAENTLRSEDMVEVKDSARKVFESAHRSARLAEQLLDMAHLESAGLAQAATRLDLGVLIQAVARDFEEKARANGQALQLDIAPACFVHGHVDSLGILLRNLIDNAVRHGGAGAHICVACHADAAGSQVRLCIRDDGRGVPLEHHARIFERFYRVPDTHGHGSGIGLSLVARIARLHRAELATEQGIGGRGLGITLVFAAA